MLRINILLICVSPQVYSEGIQHIMLGEVTMF